MKNEAEKIDNLQGNGDLPCVSRSVFYLGYKIELVKENNGITYPFKIGINGIFNYGYAPSVENGIALGKEFVGTIMRFAN